MGKRSKLSGFLAAAILLLCSSTATATDRYWIVSSGGWSTAANWVPLPGTEPSSADNAYIQNSGTATITASGEVCKYLYLGNTNSGTVNMTAGSLTISGFSYIGYSSTGVFTQSGGTNAIVPSTEFSLYLGYNSGASGIYNLSGSGQLLSPSENIGYISTGIFIQSGGNNRTGVLNIGSQSDSNGTYNLYGSGALVANIDEHIGLNGTGIFTQSDGTNTISSGLYLGHNSGSNGKYNLNGSGQLKAASGYIGNSGTGTLNQSGGTNTVNALTLGRYSASSGTYNLTGGTLFLTSISKGDGDAAFNFGGGTLQPNSSFTTTLPMTLTGINGNANLDTTVFTVGLSGVLSGTGGLNKFGSGKLTLSALNTYSGDTIVNDGTLEIAGGIDANGTSLIDVQAGKALLKTVNVTKENLDITTAALATFEVANGTHEVGVIDGSGITQVDDGASLTATSIRQGTVIIGAGAKIILKPRAGIGPLSTRITPIPEPSIIVLLAGTLLALAYNWVKKEK